MALNGMFLVIEASVGWFTGSLALLSDAAHMVGDVGALTLALGAAWLAGRAASAERSFGLRRAEALGGLLNGLAMLLVVGLIFKEAVVRLLAGSPEVLAWPVLATGVVGLAINLGSAWSLARADRDNLNIRGALIHMLADALGSVGAIVAALGLMLGVAAADVVVSVFIGVLVLWGTWGLLRDTARVLMQFAPGRGRSLAIRAVLRAVDGVADVHALHLWSLDGREQVLTAHLVAEAPDTGAVLSAAHAGLASFGGLRHITLQVESLDTPCPECR